MKIRITAGRFHVTGNVKEDNEIIDMIKVLKSYIKTNKFELEIIQNDVHSFQILENKTSKAWQTICQVSYSVY